MMIMMTMVKTEFIKNQFVFWEIEKKQANYCMFKFSFIPNSTVRSIHVQV